MPHLRGLLQFSVMASYRLAQAKGRGASVWACRKVREPCTFVRPTGVMADLEHPLLAGSASEAAPTADGVHEQPAVTAGWWQRLFTAAATAEPPPEDASAWLHAHEVANRPGGPAAAAVANLSNTSAWELSATATCLLSCELTPAAWCHSHWRGYHGPPQSVQSPGHPACKRAVIHRLRPHPLVHQPPPPVRHHTTTHNVFLLMTHWTPL